MLGGWGTGEGRRRNNYLRRRQYPRRSNPSVIKHFFPRKGDPFRFLPKKVVLLCHTTVDKGKVAPTVWTTLVEILQDPNTGSHRILCRILNKFLMDLF